MWQFFLLKYIFPVWMNIITTLTHKGCTGQVAKGYKYNVTLSLVRVTLFAVEKQKLLNILSV